MECWALSTEDISRAPGIEVIGIEWGVPTRDLFKKESTNDYIVSQISFQPYVQQNKYQDNAYLSMYADKCRRVASEVSRLRLAASENAVISSLKAKLQVLSEPHHKMQSNMLSRFERGPLLQELTNQLSPRNCTSKSAESLADDILLNALLGSDLNTLLDIVRQNSSANGMKVVELGDERHRLYEKIVPYINSAAYYKPDSQWLYFKTSRKLEAMSSDKKHYGVIPVTWNIVSNHAAIPSVIRDSSLVVLGGVLHKVSNINATLNRIKEALAEGGFVLVHEPTQNFEIYLALALCGLNDDVTEWPDMSSCESERTFGPYCNSEQWREYFRKAGFQVVSEISDGVVASMYLLRSSPTDTDVQAQSMVKVETTAQLVQRHRIETEKNQATPRKSDRVAPVWLTESIKGTSIGSVGLAGCWSQDNGDESCR